MSCRCIHPVAIKVDDDAECALKTALETMVRQLDEKIRCAEASLDGFRLIEVHHDHSVAATASGMFRAVATAIATYEYPQRV